MRGGQGALEYLLLIGGAVLVAGIVLVLLLGINSSSSTQTQSSVNSIFQTERLAQGTSSGTSCLDILNSTKSTGNGLYNIQPSGVASPIPVYCDMTTDGGGWALIIVCRDNDPSCWNTSTVGTLSSPAQASSAKLSDSAIISILSSGQRTTRGFWSQHSIYNPSLLQGQTASTDYNPESAVVFNQLGDPAQWQSTNWGANGKPFQVKYTTTPGILTDFTSLSTQANSLGWTALTSQGTGCAPAANGWSNIQADSCQIDWYAGCEGAPSMSHACFNGFERANLIVWAK